MGELSSLAEPPAVGEAEGYYGQALALAEELEMRPLQARTHLGLGRLLRLSGDRERAEDHLATALGLLREMDMRFWLSRAAEELLHMGHLFVVARHNIQLYDYLKREYAGEPVTVILDRRHGQRREQRGGDRHRAPAGRAPPPDTGRRRHPHAGLRGRARDHRRGLIPLAASRPKAESPRLTSRTSAARLPSTAVPDSNDTRSPTRGGAPRPSRPRTT